MQAVAIVPGQSQTPQVKSRQGSSPMRLGSKKPEADNHIVSLMPHEVTNLSQMKIAMPIQLASIYASI